MSSRLENLIRTAVQTFATKPNGAFANPNINSNIQVLRQIMSEINPLDDIGLSRLVGQPNVPPNPYFSRVAPVTYMEIFENRTVSIGVFILKEGASIPLHDHIGMYGVLKVLYGSLKLQSYTPTNTKDGRNGTAQKLQPNITAHRIPSSLVTEHGEAAVLTPTDQNLHQITAEDGPASFLDILAPPYNPDGVDGEERDCFYYKDVGPADATFGNPDQRLLARIPCPPSFWCDSLRYTGPSLHHLQQEFSFKEPTP